MSVAYDRIMTEKVYLMRKWGIAEAHFVHRSLHGCLEKNKARVFPFDVRLSFW
jgi:hypothetical protein